MQTTMSLRDRILAIRAERECIASGLPTSSWQFRIKGVKARCPMCNVSDHSGIVAGRKRLVHCRFCGRLVCEDCSRGREEAAGYDDETMTVATNKLKLFRICDNCLDTNTKQIMTQTWSGSERSPSSVLPLMGLEECTLPGPCDCSACTSTAGTSTHPRSVTFSASTRRTSRSDVRIARADSAGVYAMAAPEIAGRMSDHGRAMMSEALSSAFSALHVDDDPPPPADDEW